MQPNPPDASITATILQEELGMSSNDANPDQPYDNPDDTHTNDTTEQPDDNPWNQPTVSPPKTNVTVPPTLETYIPTITPPPQRSPRISPTNSHRDLPNTPSQASTPRSHRTIDTNTDNTNDDDPNNLYIPRETIERRLEQLFQNLDNLQLRVSQETLPSYNQRLENARLELHNIELNFGRTNQYTTIIEAARTHLINATTQLTTITLQYSNTLNHTILPIIQRLLTTRITQCQDDLQHFQHDLAQINQCTQQLQEQLQSTLQQAQHNQQNIPIPQLSHDNKLEIENQAGTLATMETLIHQIQLLPYRHMPTIIHDALENVINPINDTMIPNQH